MIPEATTSALAGPMVGVGMIGPKDSLSSARFLAPSGISLRFKDGLTFDLPISSLEMDDSRIRWVSTKESPTGETMIVETLRGEEIPIDASTLRYLADPEYAAKCDASLKSLQFTKDELVEFVRDNPPPPTWYEELARDAGE